MKHLISAIIVTLLFQQAALGFSRVNAEFNRRESVSGSVVRKQVYELMRRASFNVLEKATGETRQDVILDESNFLSYPLDNIEKSSGIIRYQTASNNACLGKVTIDADLDTGDVTANASIRCLAKEGGKISAQSTSTVAL